MIDQYVSFVKANSLGVEGLAYLRTTDLMVRLVARGLLHYCLGMRRFYFFAFDSVRPRHSLVSIIIDYEYFSAQLSRLNSSVMKFATCVDLLYSRPLGIDEVAHAPFKIISTGCI